MGKSVATLAAMIAPLALSACSTPYQAGGFRGGYTDYRAGADKIYVAFSGNAYTDEATVMRYWHMRAAEVCGGEDKYEVVSNTQHSETTEWGDGTTSYSGTARTTGNQTTYSGTATQSEPVRFTKHTAEGYIRCVNGGAYNSDRNPSSGAHAAGPATKKPQEEAVDEARTARSEQGTRAGNPTNVGAVPIPVAAGCQYDTQCKGNRICQHKQCVEPGPAIVPVAPDAAAEKPPPDSDNPTGEP